MLNSGVIYSSTTVNNLTATQNAALNIHRKSRRKLKKNAIVPKEVIAVAKKLPTFERFEDSEKVLQEIPLTEHTTEPTAIPSENPKREILSFFTPSNYFIRNANSKDEKPQVVGAEEKAATHRPLTPTSTTREGHAKDEKSVILHDSPALDTEDILLRYKSLTDVIIPAPDLSMSPILHTMPKTFSAFKRSHTSTNIASLEANANDMIGKKVDSHIASTGLLQTQQQLPSVMSKSNTTSGIYGNATTKAMYNDEEGIRNATLGISSHRSGTAGDAKCFQDTLKHWLEYMAIGSSKKKVLLEETPWVQNDGAPINLIINDVEETEEIPTKRMDPSFYDSGKDDQGKLEQKTRPLSPEKWKISQRNEQAAPMQFAGVAMTNCISPEKNNLQPRLLLHCTILQITTYGPSKGYSYTLKFSVTNNPTTTHTGVLKSIGKGICAAHPRTVLSFNVDDSFRFVCNARLEPYHLKDILWDRLRVFNTTTGSSKTSDSFAEEKQRESVYTQKGQLILDSGNNPVRTFATNEVERYTIDISPKQSVNITLAFWVQDRVTAQGEMLNNIQEQPLRLYAEKEEIAVNQFADQVTRYCRVGDYLYFYTKGSHEKPEWVKYWTTYENSCLLIKVAEDPSSRQTVDGSVKSIPLECLTDINTNPPKDAKETIYLGRSFNIVLTFGQEQMFISCHSEHSFLMWKCLLGGYQS